MKSKNGIKNINHYEVVVKWDNGNSYISRSEFITEREMNSFIDNLNRDYSNEATIIEINNLKIV